MRARRHTCILGDGWLHSTYEYSDMANDEDAELLALESALADAKRAVEQHGKQISSLAFGEAQDTLLAAHAGSSGGDLLAVLQQQVGELQTVLEEKEAHMQALRLQARFTLPEEARLEERMLLQESVRLQLELAQAKQARRGVGEAARRLEELRDQNGQLQVRHEQRRQRQARAGEKAANDWERVTDISAKLMPRLEQLEEEAEAAQLAQAAWQRAEQQRMQAELRAPTSALGALEDEQRGVDSQIVAERRRIVRHRGP